MGRLKRATAGTDWVNYLVACRPVLAESLGEGLRELYAYLGGEMGWAPSELDKHSIADLVGWGNTRSRANERSS